MTARILIVDDDPVQRRLLEEAVRRFGYVARTAVSGLEAIEILTGAQGADQELVILDLVMPELDGIGVLGRLREAQITTPVIVQTAHGGIDVVVSAMRAGATDFIVKPTSPERLQVSIQNALKLASLEGEIARARRTAAGTLHFDDILSRSEAMERVVRLGRRAASSSIPILIEGESGTGKELVARAIQGASNRRAKPFVTVNCGAIPDNLVESILFGHEKGAFTGAVDKHVGKFQEAHGGTLFLDEVGELPLDVQVKLLRAIQDGEIDPVGARRPVRVDFRLLSATNRSLLDMVKDGRFREDLYYRLNVFPIFVPPLRDRRDDIPLLVRHFITRFAAEEKKRHVTAIAPDALALLERYDWPGNIRQLENAVFRAVVLCDGSHLTIDEFPQIAGLAGADARGKASPAPAASSPLGSDRPAPALPSPTDAAAPFGFLRTHGRDGHMRRIAEIEDELIRLAIDHYGGRMTEVARRLGIGRSTLYRKLETLGITAEIEAAAE